jgi:3-hydroxyacyl-[acyl-carrier-protein] dehydratase
MPHLLKDFYKVDHVASSEGKISAEITLNPTHEIYHGHFPGQPVVPGVCQMQMIKEILSDTIKKELNLFSGDNIKFMAIIDPGVHSKLNLTIDYQISETQILKANCSIFYGAIVFFKFSGKFNTKN